MTFTQEITAGGAIMALQGAFTFKDHHSFRALLDTLKTASGPNHILDLSGVDFLDSAALGMLLVADDETRSRGCNLTLQRPSSQIARLLELASMDTLFKIEQ